MGDLPWGEFDWGAGAVGSPKNIATARRKFRSHRFRFENDVINQDIDLQGIEIPFDILRNRGISAHEIKRLWKQCSKGMVSTGS